MPTSSRATTLCHGMFCHGNTRLSTKTNMPKMPTCTNKPGCLTACNSAQIMPACCFSKGYALCLAAPGQAWQLPWFSWYLNAKVPCQGLLVGYNMLHPALATCIQTHAQVMRSTYGTCCCASLYLNEGGYGTGFAARHQSKTHKTQAWLPVVTRQ